MKNRLEQAIEILTEKEASCIIYRTQDDIRTSEAIGIKPLMVELRKNKSAFEGCVIADKVIGKAAALMMILGKAEAVYGRIMSESAKQVLEAHGIEYQYETMVPYIENRTKTGLCPMEETVVAIEEPEIAFEALEKTIAKLMAQK